MPSSGAASEIDADGHMSDTSSNHWLVVDGLPVHHSDQAQYNFVHARDVYRLSFQAMGGNDSTNILTKDRFIS